MNNSPTGAALYYLCDKVIDVHSVTQNQLISVITNFPPVSVATINSLLALVVEHKDFCEAVILLLRLGADVHYCQEICLQTSVGRGQFNITKLLIDAGANIHALDSQWRYDYFFDKYQPSDIRNILYIAVLNNDANIIRLLLQQGADVRTNSLLLAIACRNCDYKLVQTLLESGIDVHARDDIALETAINCDHYDIAVLLIKHGANIHASHDLFITYCRSVKMATLLLEQGANIHADNDRVLHRAIYLRNWALTKFLLMNGADVNANNGDALNICAPGGSIDITTLLLDNGADVTLNASGIINNIFDIWGQSEIRTEPMLRLLIKYGLDIRTDNELALRRATFRNNVGVVRLLLEHGADIHVNNDEAICFSAKYKYAAMVLLLLNHGANMYVDEETRLYCTGLLDI